jgi:hypothetical protein
MKTSRLLIAGLLAALLGLPSLATEHAPKSKPGAKSKAKAGKAKPKAEPKADAKADAAAQAGSLKEDVDRLNENQRRRAEADQKDRMRGTGASSGATSSTPSAPSGVDTTR